MIHLIRKLYRFFYRLYLKEIFNLVLLKNLRFLINYKKSICLRSVPKSGTNYLRLILSNYFFNMQKPKENWEVVTYDFMHFQLFPNVRAYIINGKDNYKKQSFKIHKNNNNEYYNDFMYDHGSKLDTKKHINPKKLILLYRNPLDYLISRFFYSFKNRTGKEKILEHPRELIKDCVPQYARTINSINEIHKNNSNSIFISYEELKLTPHNSISQIIQFLDIPLNNDLIEFSLDASSIDKVRAQEKERGEAIHAPKAGLKGSFARSGAIGQWKEYFNEQDINHIKTILNQYNIDLNNFILEPTIEQTTYTPTA